MTEDTIKELTISQALAYEIHSSRWAGFMVFEWGQLIAVKYYVWKTERKFARYQNSLLLERTLRNKSDAPAH